MNTTGSKSLERISHVVLMLISLCCILPFFLMVMSSFSSENRISSMGTPSGRGSSVWTPTGI